MEPISQNKDVRELSDEFRQKFVVQVQGKDFVVFDGLMSLAHAEGDITPVQGIRTTIIQMPVPLTTVTVESEKDVLDPDSGKPVTLRETTSTAQDVGDFEMTCVVMAEVTDKLGNVWTGIGDASPKSIANKRLIPAIIRMAETRAIGRALRMALGIGTMLEELENPYAVPMINDMQTDMMRAVMKKKNIDRDFVANLALRYFGVKSSHHLTEAQAGKLIDILQNDLYEDEGTEKDDEAV